jgi:hypothetical protein
VSCYFRHLKEILAKAGIEVNSDNRKQLDQAIYRMMGVEYKGCPATWKRLKQEVLADDKKQREFIAKLRAALK